eukprot:scaffold544_cov117-Isochrysis_galbana.AAC.17
MRSCGTWCGSRKCALSVAPRLKMARQPPGEKRGEYVRDNDEACSRKRSGADPEEAARSGDTNPFSRPGSCAPSRACRAIRSEQA